ncbi:MAG: bifunctional DNA-formamidopyrimidine glycosylase/DNA-(apurinic or apyrimidinic site) lyase [Proteobacteria bacterium]|nr:bifunctional DNA-formamidopyrimidine glycosylase/DNA-(apurinic or apyrimidinic site) lyase [Pseudomonadota bacterium]
MPELPEVEVLKKALIPYICDLKVKDIHFFRKDLRDAIPISSIQSLLCQTPATEHATISSVARRGKYLLIDICHQNKAAAHYAGSLICHLGMSGHIRVYNRKAFDDIHKEKKAKHTHWILRGTSHQKVNKKTSLISLHYIDPRRFGRLGVHVGHKEHLCDHPYLQRYGIEPTDVAVNDLSGHLFKHSRKRTLSIKAFIMNQHIVVGVGNIYVCEALYTASISPFKPAGELSKKEYQKLAKAIQSTLHKAIASGGSTLKDYWHSKGEAGMFPLMANVYGRKGEPCKHCGHILVCLRQHQRSTFMCPYCQKNHSS